MGHSVGSFAINTTVGILGFLNPAEKIGLKPNKEDVGQTLGSYGFGPGCYFVLPVLGPTTMRDSVGLIADTFVDPFAHVTLRERKLLGASGNTLDYYTVKGTDALDFRAENDKNLEILEKNSLDLYSSFKSVYLQDRENKIKNSIEDEDDWGNLKNSEYDENSCFFYFIFFYFQSSLFAYSSNPKNFVDELVKDAISGIR